MGLKTLTDFAGSRSGKWITLALWVVIVGVVTPLAPTLTEISTNNTLDFLPQDSESRRAAELAGERFPSDSTPAIVVIRNPDGLSEDDLADAEAMSAAFVDMTEEPASNVASVVSVFTVPAASAELISPDNTTMTMIVNVTGSAAEEAYSDRIDLIREVTDQYDTAALQVKVSGPGGLVADLVSVFRNIDGFLLLVTVSLVLVLLIIIYRSPVVALVPILLVGLVFQLSNSIGALVLDAVDFSVNGQATGIMTVILFGAGTDYILFISSRYREELGRTEDKHEAIQRSMRAVGGAIISAGGTVIAASMILLFADLGSYQSLGPVIAIAIGIMLLAGLTLVPAVLAITGRFSFWPFSPRYDPRTAAEGGHEARSRLWTRIARTVLARPGTVLGVTVAGLLLLASGSFRINPTYDSLESLPSDVDSVEGFDLLREAFPAGELAPTQVYIQFGEGENVLDPENLQLVSRISRSLAGLDGVAAASGPANPFGLASGPGPDAVTSAIDLIPPEVRRAIAERRGGGPMADPELEAVGLYISALGYVSIDGSIAELNVILAENPYSAAAMDLMPELRDAAREAAVSGELPESAVLVGGETAQNYDSRAANNRDIFVILPLVLLAIMIILGLLLRSVVAAIYLGATIVLTYFATLGLSILTFEFIFGHDSIGNSVPFLLFVFLNALGVNYSIYLMSRVREEAAVHELNQATELALATTGGVITSAGLILAGTFAALMTLPLRDLLQLGFAVSVGVLMDTFITRTLLVPTLVKLLGRWNWWPSRHATSDVAERGVQPGGGD